MQKSDQSISYRTYCTHGAKQLLELRLCKQKNGSPTSPERTFRSCSRVLHRDFLLATQLSFCGSIDSHTDADARKAFVESDRLEAVLGIELYPGTNELRSIR